MKRLFQLICLGVLLCCASASFARDVITIVSIPPIRYFVKQIAGDKVKVEVLIPPGASPTTFEPKPRQIKIIKQANVYFAIGVPFEKVWLDRIKKLNPDLIVNKLYKGVVRVPMAHRYKDVFSKKINISNKFLDPHIWLSPSLVRIILQEIRDFFMSYDGENKNFYLSNYYKALRDINSMEQEFIKIFSNCKNRYFLVFHPSWGYFARDYGLVQIPIELEGKEPSFWEVSNLISFARKHKIKVVFIEPEFSKKMAKVIAASLKARVEEIDPLAEDWKNNLMQTAHKIADSLR